MRSAGNDKDNSPARSEAVDADEQVVPDLPIALGAALVVAGTDLMLATSRTVFTQTRPPEGWPLEIAGAFALGALLAASGLGFCRLRPWAVSVFCGPWILTNVVVLFLGTTLFSLMSMDELAKKLLYATLTLLLLFLQLQIALAIGRWLGAGLFRVNPRLRFRATDSTSQGRPLALKVALALVTARALFELWITSGFPQDPGTPRLSTLALLVASAYLWTSGASARQTTLGILGLVGVAEFLGLTFAFVNLVSAEARFVTAALPWIFPWGGLPWSGSWPELALLFGWWLLLVVAPMALLRRADVREFFPAPLSVRADDSSPGHL